MELEAGVRGLGSGVRGQESGVRSWSLELELENGGQIPLLFLLYFVAKNKNQPQRTVDDRSERFGGFWGEAFGHRRL